VTRKWKLAVTAVAVLAGAGLISDWHESKPISISATLMGLLFIAEYLYDEWTDWRRNDPK